MMNTQEIAILVSVILFLFTMFFSVIAYFYKAARNEDNLTLKELTKAINRFTINLKEAEGLIMLSTRSIESNTEQIKENKEDIRSLREKHHEISLEIISLKPRVSKLEGMYQK